MSSKARNKWDVEQRRTLVILHTNFPGLSTEQRLAIFNVYHRDHLLTRGLLNGLGVKAFREQYGERVSKPQNWGAACSQPSTDQEWQRQRGIIQKICTIAATLKIGETETPSLRQTATRQSPAASPVKKSRRQVIRRQQCHVAISSEQPVTETADEAEIPVTPVTPASSSRKRAIARLEQRQRAAEQSRVSTARKTFTTPATVSQHLSTQPPTTPGTSAAKVTFERREGGTLLLSPEAHARAQEVSNPVLPHQAHHQPSRLLFRYFNNDISHLGEKANGALKGEGFHAGRYRFNNTAVPAAPESVSELLLADFENHMDQRPIDSPFVSTTDYFLWVLSRIALKEYRKGRLNGHISIIDSAALPSREIFYPRVYHQILKVKKAFTKGAWHYSGRSEYLVWGRIPQHAIINTFSVRRLVELVNGSSALRASLRFEQISRSNCGLENTIRPELTQDEYELTHPTIVGFGKLCSFLGLIEPFHVQSIVTSLVFGWRFQIQAQRPELWARDATLFAEAFLTGGDKPVLRLEYVEQLKLAYLCGVREGHKAVFCMLHEPERERNAKRMERTAAEIGLGSPADIMLSELQNARLAINQYAEQDHARFTVQAPLSRGMLESPGSSGQVSGGDVDMVGDSDDDFRMDDDIVYEKDDDSSSDYEDMNGLS
ncbi:hypothetical protein KC315_g3384 [Hortaea werneckii]|nr:hypothetical protein KC315_g3384 [Hortaea werneckii]KAI7350715.1 hypothetical protein KC354_g12710 [Hortaea werneckii]